MTREELAREELIKNLKYTMKKHENDKVDTFGTNISLMCKDMLDYLEQEPCSDAISRQAVIKAITKTSGIRGDALNALYDLPPVNPQPKTGHWITQWDIARQKEYYYCSECREEFSYDGETGIKMNDYKYCPNCGLRLESET